MWLLIIVFQLFFTPSQALICQAYGSMYEVEKAYLADLICYKKLAESAADIAV